MSINKGERVPLTIRIKKSIINIVNHIVCDKKDVNTGFSRNEFIENCIEEHLRDTKYL